MIPFARVSLGPYVWNWGDGYLRSVRVQLGEGEKSSSCEIELFDPGRKFIDAFLEFIESIEGLEPLETPDSATSSTGVDAGNGTADGSLSANMRAALDLIALGEVGPSGDYSTAFGGGTLASLADHPEPGSDLPAGRYQIQGATWSELRGSLPDFSPQSQDAFALLLIERRGATADIEAGDIEAALTGTGGTTGLAWEWAAMPPSRYGQSKLTLSEAIAFFEERQQAYSPGSEERSAAVESVEAVSPTTVQRNEALTGSQITIELGFDGQAIAAYSFLHTSLDFSVLPNDILRLGGQASAWVLTQRKRNSAYQNVTFKQVAEKVCSAYGLTLDMEVDGPTYEYFPQRGQSDYEMLLSEARRIGYRITSAGSTLTIKPRGEVDAFTLVLGENLGLQFDLSHSAQSDSGGARSSDPSLRSPTGQRKTEIDPDTGRHTPINAEVLIGAGDNSPEEFTTGAAVTLPTPKTTGGTDGDDAVRKANETRVKGITATWAAPTSTELLLVTPDDAIRTEAISGQIDRVWVCESITHEFGLNGVNSSGALYSPMRNKYPQPPASSTGVNGDVPALNANGFIKPSAGQLTSDYRTARRPNHKGVDLAGGQGSNIWASADGVVNDVQTGCTVGDINCGSGYGNLVFITHADGYETRYAHLSRVDVSIGDSVKQGQVIGGEGDTGHSFGSHLHFEIRQNGTDVNPNSLITL